MQSDGGARRFCAAAPAARETGAPEPHSPYASGEVSYGLIGQRAQNLRAPPFRCARSPAPRRSSAGSAASSPPRDGPCCRALRASPRAAKGKPDTQVGLLEQGYAAVQVSRGVTERAAVLRNGKREARDSSRGGTLELGTPKNKLFELLRRNLGNLGSKSAYLGDSNHN